MRNVVVARHTCGLLDDVSGVGEELTFLALDIDSGRRFFASSNGHIRCVAGETDDSAADEVLWELRLGEVLPGDSVCSATPCLVAAEHVVELGAMFLATACGAVLLLDPERRGVEEVGAVEAGLLSARWSPDGEVVALLTADSHVLLMGKEWDVIEELVLEMPAEGSSEVAGRLTWRGDGQLVAANVQAADGRCGLTILRRDPFEVVASVGAVEGLGLPIDWQPNGRHLYGVQATGAGPRVLLYENVGLPHGGFDAINIAGVEGEGAGGAGGLGKVTGLQWSADSEVLALSVDSGEEGGGVALQVWRRGNWHWDLKHEMRFPFAQGLTLAWDPERVGRLRVFTACGELHTLTFALSYLASSHGTAAVIDGTRLRVTPLRHSVVPPPLCAATVAFEAAVQAVGILSGESDGGPEALVAVLADGGLAMARCVESDLWEETAEAEDDDSDGDLLLRASRIICDAPLAVGRLVRHVACPSRDILLLVAGPRAGESTADDVLLPLQLRFPDSGVVEATVGDEIPVGGAVQLLSIQPGEEAATLLQLTDGSLLRFTDDGSLHPVANFPRPCIWMAPFPSAAAESRPAMQCPALGLDSGGALYCGRATIATAVTSAALRSWGPGGPFLLYTTRANTLHTLSMPQVAAAVSGQPSPQLQRPLEAPVGGGKGLGRRAVPIGHRRDGEENHYSHMHAAMRPTGAGADDCTVRRIEAGGVLVACPPGGHTAILQMPRGNLETVEPRHLVLAAVADALRGGDYRRAWQVARESRLDLNVLVDFRWPTFLQRAGEFVRAVPNEPDICDLLVSLRPHSTVADGGEYSAMCRGDETGVFAATNTAAMEGDAVVVPLSEKVSAVCRALRAALIEEGEERYTIGILTSHARHAPPELGAALQRIKALREAEVAGGSGGGGSAAAGLRSLLLYCQPGELYRTALGLYDLPLAYMVVDVAGLDPGDYLDDLKRWQVTQPPAAQKAAIDRHLGHWRDALAHLAELPGDDAFSEALRLAREKGLLRHAMQLFKDDAARYASVMAAYAESLSTRNLHEDAALAWLAAGEREAALSSYQEAGEWRQALALAHSLGLSPEKIKKLAANLAEDMRGNMTPVHAATLHLEYLKDVDGAVALFAQAQAWRDALWTAQRFERQDLVKTVVVPSAADAAATLMQDSRDTLERVRKYSARLQEVRSKRLALSAMMEAEDEGPPLEDDGSSVISGMSAYTAASTAAGTASSVSGRTPSTVGGRRANATRRRQKGRKKGSGIRQGTAGEERALAEHIRGLEPTAEELAKAGQLCELLVTYGHVEDAARVQAALSALLSGMSTARADVDAHALPPLEGGPDVAKVQLGSTAWKWDILRGAE